MPAIRPRNALGTFLWALLLATAAPSAASIPTIAAASDLQFALEEIASNFTRETGQAVRLSFGSSGNFATQIRNGAPFELYLSADEDYISNLHAEGHVQDAGVLYGIGRIVLMAPSVSGLQVDAQLTGLADLVATGRLRRFAIANPEHAPYGRRAQEALQHAGLWERIVPKLVLGENVSQAAQFALSGSADGGIVALSLALAPPVAARGRYALIPESWHAPLRQRMVLLKGAGPAARAFYAYLQSPSARTVMRRYGFLLPGESN